MYTDEQFEALEKEELEITNEAILAMLVLLHATKSSLEKELRNFYSTYGKDGVVTYSEARKWSSGNDHRRRITLLTLYINENFDKLKDGLTPELKAMLEDVIAKESEFFEKEVDSEEVLATPWGVDESTWYDRLVNDVALWCAYILVDIKQHLLKRNHIDDVLVKLDKRFKSMENIITALGLSESTAIGSLSRKQIFKELGIDKYRFYARVDERTCETCGSLHGLVFPISAYEVGVTASPVHPRCRCWEVPITE